MEEEYVRGTCQTMCPIKEAKLRERENLLHRFEMKRGTECSRRPEHDINKTIKSFSRSAAGSETTKPSNLRPFPVLLKTIDHLYREVFPIHREKPVTVYDFMFDRFRAVRQDAVIQNLSAEEMIQILEPIVRFFIYFGYVLIEEDEAVFEAHIHNVHLQECMKRLLVCYNETGIESATRWKHESAYVLFNLGNMKPLTRGYNLCDVHQDDIYQQSLEISLQWFLKNYFRVFKMITKLPPLLACVVAVSIPDVRKYTLQAMTHAYSSPNCSYPVEHVKNILGYESGTQVVQDCAHFKIKVQDGKIKFFKKDFDAVARSRKGVRLKWLDEMLSKCDLLQLLYRGDVMLA